MLTMREDQMTDNDSAERLRATFSWRTQGEDGEAAWNEWLDAALAAAKQQGIDEERARLVPEIEHHVSLAHEYAEKADAASRATVERARPVIVAAIVKHYGVHNNETDILADDIHRAILDAAAER